MKTVNKISLWVLCAVLFMLSGCAKNHTPAEEEQRQVIGFDAQSEATPVKATTPFSDFHNDFGVWGIARHTGKPDYILWETSAMSKVEQKGSENVYVPVEDAYWVAGYKYNFIAVAPWEAAEDISSVTAGNSSGKEKLDFTYSLADKYAADNFVFDLMASVAANEVKTTASAHQSQQSLIFWHLFSKIDIAVTFVDSEGKTVTGGTVSEIRLKEVDTDVSYSIGFDSQSALSVTSSPVAQSAETTITLSGFENTIYVVPQNISDFEIYMDFKIGGVRYDDFKLNLDFKTASNPDGKNPVDYEYNGYYRWNIKIGPKADISFKVTVEKWDEETVSDGDDDNNNDIEII